MASTPLGHRRVKPCTILYSIEINWPTLFNSLLTMVTTVTIKKTGKQVDLGLFKIIYALSFGFYDWKFPEAFLKQNLFILSGSFVKKKSTNSR